MAPPIPLIDAAFPPQKVARWPANARVRFGDNDRAWYRALAIHKVINRERQGIRLTVVCQILLGCARKRQHITTEARRGGFDAQGR